jgi:hypothetical protein
MPSAFIISRVALRRVAGHGDPFLSEHHNSFRPGRKKIYKKFKKGCQFIFYPLSISCENIAEAGNVIED